MTHVKGTVCNKYCHLVDVLDIAAMLKTKDQAVPVATVFSLPY